MRNLVSAAVAAIAVLVLASCHADTKKPAPPAPIAAPVAAPAPTAPADPSVDLKQAFVAAFGQPAPAMRLATRDDTDLTLRYRPDKLIPLRDGVVALISSARTDGCHGCYGSLAIHYLARQQGGFKVIGAWPEISDGGSFGEPPAWKMRDDLFSGPAIVADAGGTWQGCTVAYADIIELTPDKPVVRARRVLTTYDDGNNEDAGVDGTIKPEAKDHAFAVDYAGAQPRKIEYRRAGETYQASTGAPGLPSC